MGDAIKKIELCSKEKRKAKLNGRKQQNYMVLRIVSCLDLMLMLRKSE